MRFSFDSQHSTSRLLNKMLIPRPCSTKRPKYSILIITEIDADWMAADECQSTASSDRFTVSDETMREMIDLSILSSTAVCNTCIVISLKPC